MATKKFNINNLEVLEDMIQEMFSYVVWNNSNTITSVIKLYNQQIITNVKSYSHYKSNKIYLIIYHSGTTNSILIRR